MHFYFECVLFKEWLLNFDKFLFQDLWRWLLYLYISIMTFMSTFLCSVPINPNALKKSIIILPGGSFLFSHILCKTFIMVFRSKTVVNNSYRLAHWVRPAEPVLPWCSLRSAPLNPSTKHLKSSSSSSQVTLAPSQLWPSLQILMKSMQLRECQGKGESLFFFLLVFVLFLREEKKVTQPPSKQIPRFTFYI